MHVLSVASIALFSAVASAGVLGRASCSTISGVTHTFYGFPDNDPPSAQISYNCGRGNTAGGTGTYNDPLTFASAPGEFAQCEIIYDPYLGKYLRMEDYCEQCNSDWQSGTWHIDVWTGSNSNGGQTQIDCEYTLTPGPQIIIRNPPSNFKVDGGALFENGNCHTEHTHSNYDPNAYC